MGTGKANRADWRRRLARWASLLEELERRQDKGLMIPEPTTFVGEMEAGLSSGDRDQAVALVRRFVEQRGGQWVVLPSKLRPALEMIDDIRVRAEEQERRRSAGSAQPATEVRQAAAPVPPAAPPSVPVVVRISDLCKFTLTEAGALIAECAGGRLPEVFSPNLRKALSAGTWNALVEHGLVVENHQGDEITVMPDATRFEPVRFVLVDEHKRGAERWQVVPEVSRVARHEHGAWLPELRGYVERRAAWLVREAEAKARVELPLAAVIERLKRLLGRVELELAVARTAFDARIATAERAVARLRRGSVEVGHLEREMRALEAEIRELVKLKESLPLLDEERMALVTAIERLTAKR